jgi:hypothetical protein
MQRHVCARDEAPQGSGLPPRGTRPRLSTRALGSAFVLSSASIAATVAIAPAAAHATGGGTYWDRCLAPGVTHPGSGLWTPLLHGASMSNEAYASGACSGGTVAGWACIAESFHTSLGWSDVHGYNNYACASIAGALIYSNQHWGANSLVRPAVHERNTNKDPHVTWAYSYNTF